MINPKSDNKVAWLASYSIILYPFLSIYGYGILNLGTIFFLCVCIYTIIRKKRLSFSFQKPLIGYILYYLLMQIICNFPNFSRIIELQVLFYFILWGVLNKEVSFRCFFKAYRFIALINIIFFFFQEILYFIKGYRILGIMTFLPTNIVGSNMTISEWANNAITGERSSAFFSEPAHFAQFLFPLITIELFYNKDNSTKYRLVLYLLVILLLFSGNALLGGGIIFLYYIIEKLLKNRKFILPFILLFFSLIPVGIYLANNEKVQDIISRVDEMNPEQSQITSGFVRIYRGYYFWEVMTFNEKIWGLNNIDKFIEKRDKSEIAAFVSEDDFYLNGIQRLIIFVGFIGTAFFVWLLFSLYKNNNSSGRCCILIYIGLSFIASTHYTDLMVLYLLVAFLMKKYTATSEIKTFVLKYR